MKSKILFIITTVVVLLPGCSTPTKVSPPSANVVEAAPLVLGPDQFRDDLQQHEERLTQHILNTCQQNMELRYLNLKLATLIKQVDTLDKRKNPRIKAVIPEKICPAAEPSPLGDKLILGEFELAHLDELAQTFRAHVDLSSDSSTLNVDNITLFERDGNQWVRFDTQLKDSKKSDSKTTNTVEVKVRRIVRIKSSARSDKPMRYPVIRVNLTIGEYNGRTDIYLAEGGKQEHALVLGRKFIKDIAVIDISKKFIQGEPTLPESK